MEPKRNVGKIHVSNINKGYSFFKFYFLFNQKNTKKVKESQVQAWTGPEGSRRLRFPDFKTIGTRRW
jgi:hypothetical protein